MIASTLMRASLHKFESLSVELATGADDRAQKILKACATMSSTLTALGINAQLHWPFFTDPNFDVLGNEFRTNSGAQLVAFAPIIRDQRAQWELYSQENQGWIRQGLVYVSETEGADMPDQIKDIPAHIYRWEGHKAVPEIGKGPFAPLWQMARAPRNSSAINFNLLSNPIFASIFHAVLDTQKSVISKLLDGKDLFGDNDASETPTSIIVQPVSSNFSHSAVDGMLIALICWDVFFKEILPPETPEMFLVVKDGCGTAFTYQVSGGNASFVGYEDAHPRSFDSLVKTSNFAPFLTTDFGEQGSQCTYTLSVYPSSEFYDVFYTNQPTVITAVVVIVFSLTAASFCLYDCAVHKRQRRVLAIAAQSEKILSILYPKSIRDRLFGTQGGQQPVLEHRKPKKTKRKKDQASQDKQAAKLKLKTYLNDDAANIKFESLEAIDIYDSKPIADLFPNTTVMFADIAGFTAWSSVREPTQVFTLLETVYRAFDRYDVSLHIYQPKPF